MSAGRIRVTIPDGRFLPASKLKEVRRAFWEWAGREIDPNAVRAAWRDRIKEIRRDLEACAPAGDAIETITVCLPESKDAKKSPIPNALIAQPVRHYNKGTDEAILPEFCPEAELPELKRQVADAVGKGASRFRVTSLYGFDLLKEFEDLKVTASFPIPVCNRLAVRELIEIGANKATAWVELGSDELQDLLDACASALEVYTYGRIPLLSTRFKVPVSGEITDGRGARFSILEEAGLAWLYPEKVLALPAPPNVSTLIDLTHADPNEPATDSFNYFRELV